MEMLVLVAILCIAEAYIANKIYRLAIKRTYNDENKKKLYKAGITGLEFVAVMLVIAVIIIATLEAGYLKL